jgi:hypothetical protein
MKVLSHPRLPDIRKSINLFEGPNSSPVCPYGNGSTLMKMGVVLWLNGADRGKPKLKFKTNLSCMQRFGSYRTVNTITVGYKNQSGNSLNAELNPICYLLILLGYLTFMDTCIVSIFQYISTHSTLKQVPTLPR